jgi:hypothetical protein
MTNHELEFEPDSAKSRGSVAIVKNPDPDSFAFASPIKGPWVGGCISNSIAVQRINTKSMKQN